MSWIRARSPGHKACAEYLMQLTIDDDAVNYGHQVSCLVFVILLLIELCLICNVEIKDACGQSMRCLIWKVGLHNHRWHQLLMLGYLIVLLPLCCSS